MGLSVVFMGTPIFAVASLDAILKSNHTVKAIVTALDKPAGRGLNIKMPAIKEFALNKNIPLLQPNSLKDSEFINNLATYRADVFVVVAFRMLPIEVWQLPPKGTINLHASLLPQYRGAAPINWAIINGETQTGVTTFLINDQIDTGKILLQKKINIAPHENAGQLHDKLMLHGAQILAHTLDELEKGSLKPISQSDIQVDLPLKTAPKIQKEMCKIDWSKPVKDIYNHIRGLSPHPGSYSWLINENKKLLTKIYDADYSIESHDNKLGKIIITNKNKIKVAANNGYIYIKEIQLEGKKRLPVEEFLKGFAQIEKYYFE